TVIMIPKIGKDGALILESSGKKIGDAGFYFLLKDAKDIHWTKFIASFRDRLIINEENDTIYAEQTLTLWKQTVLKFNYTIQRNNTTNYALFHKMVEASACVSGKVVISANCTCLG